MIKVVSNKDIVDVGGWYRDYLDLARLSLANYVKKSGLDRNEAISTYLKNGVKTANEIPGFPRVYSVGHCTMSIVEGNPFLVDYTDVDLDHKNEVEFVLV